MKKEKDISNYPKMN